jgi:hypothetical protein
MINPILPNFEQRRKIRVLILSALIPIERSGAGCLTMQRHFLLRNDFTVAVAAARDFTIDGLPCFRIKQDKITERIRRTRLCRIVNNSDYLKNWLILPEGLEGFAREFKPDVIFSVVDDWHMGIAWRLSRRLKRPLIVDFQDLFALSEFESDLVRPYPIIQRFLVGRYRFLNRKSEQVFHVGPGMKEWFHPHERGDILYPLALQALNALPSAKVPEDVGRPIRLVYAGNSSGAYGTMLIRLARELVEHPSIQLEIYSSASGMPDSDIKWLRDHEIYKGYVPPAELSSIQQDADALLLVMSFEEDWRIFMETSFNTKWSDYLAQQKPIFVWGPGYSSACRFARESGAAHPVTSEDPETLMSEIVRVMGCGETRSNLLASARKAATTLLDPDRVHKVLCDAVARVSRPD